MLLFAKEDRESASENPDGLHTNSQNNHGHDERLEGSLVGTPRLLVQRLQYLHNLVKELLQMVGIQYFFSIYSPDIQRKRIKVTENLPVRKVTNLSD